MHRLLFDYQKLQELYDQNTQMHVELGLNINFLHMTFRWHCSKDHSKIEDILKLELSFFPHLMYLRTFQLVLTESAT